MLKLTSPLIVYPKAKQKVRAVIFLVPYTALSLWRVALACEAKSAAEISIPLLLLACAVWLVCAFVSASTRNITVVLMPTLAISLIEIISKLLPVIIYGEKSNILMSFLEICFWIAFAICFTKGIMGKCKIIIPMLCLFFGFFYAFIGYDLRAELPTWSGQINLFLILWFVLDAATFTSLPKDEMR